MLSELKMVGKWFQNEPSAAWNFEEIVFDTETQKILSSLSQSNWHIKVSEHSAKVELSGRSNNHCYIPKQYFLYALKLKPFHTLLQNYIKVLEELRSKYSQSEVIRALQGTETTADVLNDLDPFSRENFLKIFREKENRIDAKSIINKRKDNGGVDADQQEEADAEDSSDSEEIVGNGSNSFSLRSTEDFIRSILLKLLPVPDASSKTLSELLSLILSNEAVFMHLQERYSYAIPWLYCTGNGDDLMFQVMSTLGWEGKLDELQDADPVRWGDITDAFLVRPTPEPSNSNYIKTPVHYLESCKKYVFVKKGMLSATTIAEISAMVANLWPGMCIRLREGMYYVETEKYRRISGPAITEGTNRIFYGAPGTGKSHRVHHEISADADTFVTVFHPDTQHADFVGALKPAMENNQVVYRFRAGPFTNALIHALQHPDRKVSLIIEEINRASAAAVFGELFQLLDRNPDGESTYSINAADPDMLGYINQALERGGIAPLDALRIPANLSLLATMNSSDQAVMPLDTAFKRRWRFEYLPIDFGTAGIPQTGITLAIANGPVTVTWPRLAEIINVVLVECDVAEDRLVGPFFLSVKELENEEKARFALGGKLFIYLWDDVLRHHGHDRIFSSSYKTFGVLSAAFWAGKPVFSKAIEEKLAEAKVKADAESMVADSGAPQDAAG